MSSVGQALGGIVGGAIGFMVGMPLYGAQIGMSIGGFLDPPKGATVNGPRLDDLSVQTSTYGSFIPRIYGTVSVMGNVFWLKGDALTEVKNTTTQGGKGGPTQTTNTFAYYATFALGICEGPIEGVRRIWVGPDLYYDAATDDIAGIIVSNEAAKGFTLYLGTDTQEADPLIQADKGVSNTPAYRGLAYIVFDSLPLEKYGNNLAGTQIRVEVSTVGSVSFIYDTLDSRTTPGYYCGVYAKETITIQGYGPEQMQSFDGETFKDSNGTSGNKTAIIWDGHAYYATLDSGSQIDVSQDGVSWFQETLPDSGEWRSLACSDDTIIVAKKGSNVSAYKKHGFDWLPSTMPSSANWQRAAWNGSVFCVIGEGTGFAVSSDGITWTSVSVPSHSWYGIAVKDGVFCAVSYVGSGAAVCATSSDGFTWSYGTIGTKISYRSVVAGKKYFCAVTWNDRYAAFSEDGMTWTEIDLLTSGSWNAATSIGDLFYIVNYSGSTSVMVLRPDTPYSAVIPLSDIVSAESLKSNLLTSSDIDVTQLTDDVRGYRVSQLGAIRGGIDPLRAAWPFDVVQHGYKILFKKRGSASVATIPAADLDARPAGSESGAQITDVREMDLVLPKKVTVNYLDVVREYDTNTQYSERINTDAVNELELELPIVLNANEAAQKSETLLYLYWMERYDINFILPHRYAQLEPADVITVEASNATYELRLVSTNTLPDGRVECKAKYNKATIYSPAAVGEEGQSTGSSLVLGGPSAYRLLDIPLMRDDDDTAGFPVAMGGYNVGWPGGVLYRSDDGGQTWSDIAGFPSPGSTIGYAPYTLPVHGGTVFDSTNRLRVYLNSGTLSSVTEAQLFSGQNWFAYGVDGRWEILAALTCELQTNGSYILSNFLRGQKGTEWATGLHQNNDSLVLLNSSTLSFVSVNSSSIGTARSYRGITVGKSLDSDSDLAFTYQGVNLECLSPVHLTGNRHPSTNDWTLTWVRRSRFGEWRDYVDAVLGEGSELYVIEIYSSGTYTTLIRSLVAATQTVSYPLTGTGSQTADFGGAQSTLYLKIYQLSNSVGFGYPLTTSITR